MCVLPRGRQYISSPIWVGLMSELILHWFFQHLIQAGIFLSLHNAFQQGDEANFQVFPVFLLSDASRLRCCRVRALGPLPSAHGVGGHLLWVLQRPGLLLEKQNLWQREASALSSLCCLGGLKLLKSHFPQLPDARSFSPQRSRHH